MNTATERIAVRRNQKRGMGWRPDLPDFRDFTPEQGEIGDMLTQARVARPADSAGALRKGSKPRTAPVSPSLPSKVDLRQWFSPVEDQETIGSCTAHAGVGLVEYFENRAFGKYVDASRLFLYKVSRNLLQWNGDTGAYLRTAMKALVCFGVPPEEFWPYDVARFDEEPAAFLYAFGQNYKTLQYYRLDPPGTARANLLNRVRANLAAGLPAMFGFTVYSSIQQAENGGAIPFPLPSDRREGGHAVDVAGYDDNMTIKHTGPGAQPTKGALLIRNSWGPDWGQGGYGWLPYEYILRGLAVDWWSVIDHGWIDTGQFGLDA
jgi:C1A family cysteine protease